MQVQPYVIKSTWHIIIGLALVFMLGVPCNNIVIIGLRVTCASTLGMHTLTRVPPMHTRVILRNEIYEAHYHWLN